MPEAESQPARRRTRAAYEGHNGFIDPIRLRVHGQIHAPNLHGKPAETDTATVNLHARHVRDAVERRRFVEDVLQLKGSYFPGIFATKEMVDGHDTAANVKERINELRTQHRDDMQTLYDWQANDYLEEAKDRYFSKDDGVSDPQTDVLYRSSHSPHSHLISAFDDAVSAHRYAHLRMLSGLIRQHAALTAKEDTKRRHRDAQFPADLAQYRAIRNKDIRLRIARFLMADKNTKERMLTEFRWAWRQVQGLVDEYEKNNEFQAEIQELTHDSEARDPRRKPSAAD